MADIKNPNLIIIKGLLFLVLGLLASGLLIFFAPRMEVIALLGISIWACCRFYYFCFYVIEKYIDPAHKFDGLYATLIYLLRRRSGRSNISPDDGCDS